VLSRNIFTPHGGAEDIAPWFFLVIVTVAARAPGRGR
jgi:hypothetical protein